MAGLTCVQLREKEIPIILDPVMVSNSGQPLLQPEAIHVLKTELVPLTTLITPNLPEALALTEEAELTLENMPTIAHKLLELGVSAVLLKGGHLEGDRSDDFYLDSAQSVWLKNPRVITSNTHGTGCTLSAAIAAYVAKGIRLVDACFAARNYLQHALLAAKDEKIGQGCGPVHHFHALWPYGPMLI